MRNGAHFALVIMEKWKSDVIQTMLVIDGFARHANKAKYMKNRPRSLEHINALENKKSHSFLFKHKIVDHSEENVEFGLEITGVYKDALSRQANESVRIYSRNNSEILNSKSEFNHPPTARVLVEKKRNGDYKAKQVNIGRW